MLALGAAALSSACFAYAPPRTAPEPGAQVALVLTDSGRTALAATVGPGVRRVEGILAGVEGDDYLLDGSWVTLSRGNQVPVEGGRVRVNQGYVALLEQRRLSPRRTYPAVGGALVLVAAFFITRGFVSRGTPPETSGEPPGPDNSIRGR
jgi:hypothetical protein